MTDKTITLRITGPHEIIESCLASFAKQYGWTETVPNPQGGEPIDNPQAQEEKARLVIRQFIMDSVIAYTVAQAKLQAAQQASQGSAQAIDLTTLTLVVE